MVYTSLELPKSKRCSLLNEPLQHQGRIYGLFAAQLIKMPIQLHLLLFFPLRKLPTYAAKLFLVWLAAE